MTAGIAPVVAHGLQDSIVELNGARDEEGGVSFLGGHAGWLDLLLGVVALLELGAGGVVFEVGVWGSGAFCGERSVEFQWFTVQMSRDETQTRLGAGSQVGGWRGGGGVGS